MRKGFKFIKPEAVVTPVYDAISATIPDQSLSLREMMMRFAYMGTERIEEIVNRGYDGDEDDDLLGVDVSALDYAEVHDRLLDMQLSQKRFARSLHISQEPVKAPEVSAEATADEAPAE